MPLRLRWGHSHLQLNGVAMHCRGWQRAYLPLHGPRGEGGRSAPDWKHRLVSGNKLLLL